jgi:ribonuclease HI
VPLPRCRASGAKFNIEKTEIIPIGTEEHRSTIITTRKINPLDQTPLHDQIRIAKDGEATRSLGAWIGNHTNDLTPWETILDKIHKALKKWRQTRPTLQGRKIIIQTVIGGHTQFLTKAQGMPSAIENALTKMIRDFIWEDDSSPRIALNTLYQPIEQGGLNLLDLQARNEAIEITWLREYLNLSPSRPTWAKITDLVINAAAPPGTSRPARINTFLQSWNPPTKGPRLALLDNDTIRMLKAAKKHNTNLAAIRLSPNLRAQLPAWYHMAMEKRPLTTTTAKCLLTTHRNTTVADLISTSARLHDPERLIPHIPNPQCPCTDCINDRSKHCLDPHACAIEAQARIHLIPPKLNPLEPGDNHGNLSLTPSKKERNQEARRTDGLIRFDPSITCKNNLAECFRIFTDPNRISTIPARRHNTQGANLRHRRITIYTDGACNNNGKMNAQCGSGIWFGPEHEQNLAIRIPGHQQSNQIGEIAAIVAAVEAVPKFWPLTIVSDSKYAIEGLTIHLQSWEDNGWIGIKNAAFFKRAAFLLRSRTATTDFQWVKGHNGDPGNEQSDQLAKDGANKPEADPLTLEIPKEFDLQGAKLATITQATAYRGIREHRTNAPRPTTSRNIQTTREAIHAFSGNLEKDDALWKGTRNRNIRTKIQQFIYKTMHGTQKIGDFWRNINNYEARQTCSTCKETETMEHILIHCNAAPSRTIWDLAKTLWPHPPQLWPDISLGIILGCGSISLPETAARPARPRADNQMTVPKGATRLLQILLSESAHLIWVLRCERVIQDRSHTTSEIKNRWTRAINIRLTDESMTNSQPQESNAIRSLSRPQRTHGNMSLGTRWTSQRTGSPVARF